MTRATALLKLLGDKLSVDDLSDLDQPSLAHLSRLLYHWRQFAEYQLSQRLAIRAAAARGYCGEEVE